MVHLNRHIVHEKLLSPTFLIFCFSISSQKIIKEAGKYNLDEIKVASNIEEMTVKEFKIVVRKLQTSLKREKQVHTLKAIHEKNKLVSF